MDVLKYEDKFLEAGCMALDVADQNQRAFRAKKEIEDAEFQELALMGLEDEQHDTMVELKQLADSLPYEQLGCDYLAAQEKIRLLREELENGLEEDNEARLAIRALSSLVTEISPRVKQEAEELADRRIKELDDTSKEKVWQEIKDMTKEGEHIARLFEDVSDAWELPTLYSGHPDGLYLEDTIPVEPELCNRGEIEFEEFKERHIDQPEATQEVAYFLSKNVNQVVDALDIAHYIYSEEVCAKTPENALRSRVTTLLGPEREGAPVPTMLEAEGLILQYGWRKCLEWCGDKKKVTRILRIYRVYQEGDTPEDLVQSEHPEYEIVWTSNGYLPLSQSRKTEKELTDLDEPQPEPESVVDLREECMPSRVKEVQRIGVKDLDSKTRRSIRWAEFAIDTQESISELIERGVILHRSSPVSLKLIRIKSGSRIMGTQESLRRMAQVGLISRHASAEDSLQPEQIVAMHMLNTNHKNFRAGKSEALKIIARELDRVFEENL